MERILRELKPLASSKVSMNISLFNGAVIYEQLNYVKFLGAGFGILHLANPLDVNEVTVTRETILGNEKLLTPTCSQSQALIAYYTTLISRPINAAAAAVLNKYNYYDSEVFHIFSQ